MLPTTKLPNIRLGRLNLAVFNQYLAIYQKLCKIGHSYCGRLETCM